MAFELSFTPEFFFGEGYSFDEPPPASDEPNSVLQALYSKSDEEIRQLWRDANCDDEGVISPEQELNLSYMAFDTVVASLFESIERVNTCTDLTVPVSVWLDDEGWTTIEVYE